MQTTPPLEPHCLPSRGKGENVLFVCQWYTYTYSTDSARVAEVGHGAGWQATALTGLWRTCPDLSIPTSQQPSFYSNTDLDVNTPTIFLLLNVMHLKSSFTRLTVKAEVHILRHQLLTRTEKYRKYNYV